ncbi:MAG: transporter [Arenicellales bacterium]|nr:transporter [Arenicellales bacterium]
MTTPSRIYLFVVTTLLFLTWSSPLSAQQLEPRRWSHLPVGAQFFSLAYLYTDGDIFLDPVLRIEDAGMELHTFNVRYLYSFGLAGMSARIEADVPYVKGRWQGLVNEEFRTTEREGIADPRLRLSVLLHGGPALSGKAFAKYQNDHSTNTVVGAGVSLTLPIGEYFRDRLINLGENRFVLRPELGVLHIRHKWSYELTGSISLFEDNDDFWPSDSKREQNPLLLIQGHVVYTFRPGLWTSVSAGYGFGGESSVNDVARNDKHDNYFWALTLGVPLTRHQRIKLAYAGVRTNNLVGVDSHNLLIAWSSLF